MIDSSMLFILAGGGAGAAIVAFDRLRRKRAAERREKRLQDLRIFARRRGLGVVDGAVPDHILDRATPRFVRGRAVVEDVMLGRDERGNYYALRRRHRGRTQQALAFDLAHDSHVDGFSIEPHRRGRSLSLLQKLLRRRRDERPRLRSSWECDARTMVEESAVERCGRLVQVVARENLNGTAMPLALRVDGRRVLIYSQAPYSFEQLSQFLDAALVLRGEVLSVLNEKLRGYSAEIRPIAEAVRSVAQRTLERAKQARARERADRQSGPWSTVMDVPPELARGRAPESKIEKEEVEVVVLSGRGIPI